MNPAMLRLGINVWGVLSVSKVVNDVIRNNTTVVTTADALKVWTGSMIIGGVIVDHSMTHFNDQIDNVIAWFNSAKNKNNDDKK